MIFTFFLDLTLSYSSCNVFGADVFIGINFIKRSGYLTEPNQRVYEALALRVKLVILKGQHLQLHQIYPVHYGAFRHLMAWG